MNILKCPHCNTKILLSADNTCPNCHKIIDIDIEDKNISNFNNTNINQPQQKTFNKNNSGIKKKLYAFGIIVTIIGLIIIIISLLTGKTDIQTTNGGYHDVNEILNTATRFFRLGSTLLIYGIIISILSNRYKSYIKSEISDADSKFFNKLPKRIKTNGIIALCLCILILINIHIFALIWAPVALFQSIKADEIKTKFPDFYDDSSNKKIKNGIKMSVIAISLSLIGLVFFWLRYYQGN